MARPSTKDGFVMVALDLWGAILTATLTDYERIIVAEVVGSTYGKAKRNGCRLDLTGLAETTNIDRRNLKRAYLSLVAARILTVNEDGSVIIQKDWELWKRPPEAGARARKDDASRSLIVGRLAGGLVSFCSSLVDRFGTTAPAPGGSKSGGSIEPPATGLTGVQSNPSNNCDRGSIEPPCGGFQGVQSNPSHIEERAAEELRERNKEQARNSRAGGREDFSALPESDPEPTPAPARQPHPSDFPMPEGFAEVCRKADRIRELQASAFGPCLRGAWLQRGDVQALWEAHPDPGLWIDALAILAKPGKQRSLPYYLGIVRREAAQGTDRQHARPAAPPKKPEPIPSYLLPPDRSYLLPDPEFEAPRPAPAPAPTPDPERVAARAAMVEATIRNGVPPRDFYPTMRERVVIREARMKARRERLACCGEGVAN